MAVYTRELFDSWREGSRAGARAVVPTLEEIFEPRSVVDLGCGTGAWLAAFDLDDVLGVDSHAPSDALDFPSEKFRRADLAAPFELDRRFDLALSLEVGEHLAEVAASPLVESLVALAPAVVFSAAIPGQPGIAHVNCQWPEWWAALFREHNYRPCDCLRFRFWDQPEIPFYYPQNMIVYSDRLEQFGLEETAVRRLVHPGLYEKVLAAFPAPEYVTMRSFAGFVARMSGLR
jgi:SAM-dependent methyltransferase